MKLVKCYIANFGKLSNFNYNFSSGLNILNKENGWGKTTLADFIKAMLYSLPASRARSLKDNPRKKYKPWNGGEFGGNLVIEVNENIYRIERLFGNTESEDTFKLFNEKTNKISSDYSSNIGFEIFGLDAESFSKTTYLPQLELKIELTDNISAKLSDLTRDKDDVNSFNTAISSIDEKRKIYQKTGERGKYYELLREYESLQAKKDAFTSLNATVQELDNNRTAILSKINELESNEASLQHQINNNIENQKYKDVTKLQKEIDNIDEQIKLIESNLHGNIPTLSQLKNIQKQSDTKVILQKEIELVTYKIENENKTLNKTLNFFITPPTNDEIQTIETEINNYRNSKNTTRPTEKNIYKNQLLKIITATIGFDLIALISLCVCFFMNIINFAIFGIIATLVIVFGLAIIFISIKKLKNKTKFDNSNLNNENKLDSLLRFNFEKELSLDAKIYVYLENLKIKKLCEDKLQQLNLELENFIAKLNSIQNQLDELLHLYGKEGKNINDIILNLSRECSRYDELQSLKQKKIDDYQKLSVNINIHKSQENLVEQDFNKLSQKLKNVSEELSNSRKEYTNINLQLERYNQKLTELEDVLSKEESIKNELDEIKRKLKVFEYTDKYLKLAKDELDSAFLEPITKSFTTMINSLNASAIENFKIDTNFNISVINNGQTKELSFFSKGYQDIAYICARLASVDAMFKDQKLFIILDDPFVNLDNEKLELAKNLLREISKNFQILYLVCHDSRT